MNKHTDLESDSDMDFAADLECLGTLLVIMIVLAATWVLL
ncbi:hypothetical protein SAMN05216510_1570 [Pseudomonas coleopterorum]|jgi:hypothetical protein|nr:hypothetical protein SAMN05216510_1570 [Pseudomonas coleopterorum]